MSGNSFGKCFVVSTFGESHGPALGAIVDGCPPGLPLTEADLQRGRRPAPHRHIAIHQPAQGSGPGAHPVRAYSKASPPARPSGCSIENTDARSRDYEKIKDRFRPGHADYTYQQKYGLRDYRGGGRSSARETVMRVAAGAIARKYLARRLGVSHFRLRDPGGRAGARAAAIRPAPTTIRSSAPTRRGSRSWRSTSGSCAARATRWARRLTVIARGVPPGLGEPVFDRLDADIAHAMMSIQAVKSVEIGDGVAVAAQRGSRARDELTPAGFATNHAGGILGGISTGQDVVAHIALKPTSSIQMPGRTIDLAPAIRSRWSPPVATIPASGCGPRRSPRPCWPSP